MSNRNIPYGRQKIDQEDIDAVVEALQADFLTQGPRISQFETEFAQYVNAKYAVAISNATAGLHISVLALGLEKGDRVITTPITFAATANCVRYAGGEVWFADIDPETYLLDLESVKRLVLSKPKGFFKGIIPVDFGGLPVNLEAFNAFAKEHDLWIIEDACHAPGGYFIDSNQDKHLCGQGKYAQCAVFSFHPVKHIASGEGGMVTTNSKEIYDRLMSLRSHGITKNDMSENHGGWYYQMKELGFNYRLTDIQAALGNSQLRKNNKGVKRRNEIAEKYKAAFQDKIKCQYVSPSNYNAHHLFIIEVEDRKGLYDYLRTQNIFTQVHYIPIHTLPYYKTIGYQGADLSNAEHYYAHCLSLPMFPSLTNEEQEFVIKKIFNYYNG